MSQIISRSFLKNRANRKGKMQSRIRSQRCIGHSKNFTRTYVQVVTEAGEVLYQTIHIRAIVGEDGLLQVEAGNVEAFTEIRPFVEVRMEMRKL